MNDKKFDLSDIQSADESDLEITYPGSGEGTGWILSIAGPAHPKTIALSEAQTRINLNRQRMIDQAQINGKKYKSPELDAETERLRNLENIISRIVGWRGLYISGEEIPFSNEKAMQIFLDRKNDKAMGQVISYLLDDQSFTKRSEMV